MTTLRELYGPISAGMQIDFFAEARRQGKTCMRGHTVDPANSKVEWNRHGNLTARCRVCRKNFDHRRNKRKIPRASKGVRQRIRDAAKEIALGVEVGSVIDKYVPAIVSARLRMKRAKGIEVTEEVTKAIWDACIQQIWEAAEDMAKDDHKKPWNYLRVKPEAEAAWDRFNKALERAYSDPDAPQPNCVNREKEFADYDEDDVPSAEEAYEKCYGCPLIEACSVYAEQERPAWGVWAGEPWAYGEVVDN